MPVKSGRRARLPALHPPAQGSIFTSPMDGNLQRNTPISDSPPKLQGEKSSHCFEMGQAGNANLEGKHPLRASETQPFHFSFFTCNNEQHICRHKCCWLCSLSQSQYFHCKPFFHYFKKSAVKICSRLELGNGILRLGETYFTCATPLSYTQYSKRLG